MYLLCQNDVPPQPSCQGLPGTPSEPEPEPESIVGIVQRAQAGDADAFGLLYERYSDLVYDFIYRRVGNWATAQDLTNDTFVRVMRKIEIFSWQGRKFEAWLLTIARNLVADHFKSLRVRMEVPSGDIPDSSELERSCEELVLESLTHRSIVRILGALNPQQQECVVLRYLHGLTVAETAKIMEKTQGAVKSLLCRALRNLAQIEKAEYQAAEETVEPPSHRRPPSKTGRRTHPGGPYRPPQPQHRLRADAAV